MPRAPKLLVLQLKRIGDLILTTPALAALRTAFPDAHITLAVSEGCAALLPAIPHVDASIVLGRGRGWAPWQQALTGGFDVCLDFTGNDRSALLTVLSRAAQRVTFEWVKKSRSRSLAYSRFVDSPVREHHTADHYLYLLRGLDIAAAEVACQLRLPASAQDAAARACPAIPFAAIHPGSARAEKYWLPARWAEVIAHLHRVHGLPCVLTGGRDDFERAHIAQIRTALPPEIPLTDLSGQLDLCAFAAVLARARLVVSCDTAAVHFAAAFRTPQIALFGVTNPFHWRPRHERATVLSAAQPDAPLTRFTPRMKGAQMEALSTALVIRASDALLSS